MHDLLKLAKRRKTSPVDDDEELVLWEAAEDQSMATEGALVAGWPLSSSSCIELPFKSWHGRTLQ